MRVIYDKGKKYGLYRFLKFASNKQLDELERMGNDILAFVAKELNKKTNN